MMADGLAVGCSCSQGNIISEFCLDQESANYSLFISVNKVLLEHGQLLPCILSVASKTELSSDDRDQMAHQS